MRQKYVFINATKMPQKTRRRHKGAPVHRYTTWRTTVRAKFFEDASKRNVHQVTKPTWVTIANGKTLRGCFQKYVIISTKVPQVTEISHFFLIIGFRVIRGEKFELRIYCVLSSQNVIPQVYTENIFRRSPQCKWPDVFRQGNKSGQRIEINVFTDFVINISTFKHLQDITDKIMKIKFSYKYELINIVHIISRMKEKMWMNTH